MIYLQNYDSLPVKGFKILIVFMFLLCTSCKKSDEEIPKSLHEYLLKQGIQEMVVDLDYSTLDIPDKKYMSLTVTYNFSTSDGTPQKEFLGFILKKDTNEWQIDKGITYTKSEKRAKELLTGALK
jgi:hypothetical protein